MRGVGEFSGLLRFRPHIAADDVFVTEGDFERRVGGGDCGQLESGDSGGGCVDHACAQRLCLRGQVRCQ
eukprot:4394511-Pyramimonas_sp.AAC.1